MGGGAWPFLVGGLICLVNSDNERDLHRCLSAPERSGGHVTPGLYAVSIRKLEAITGL